MRRSRCSAARALEVVGESWSLIILDAMVRGFTGSRTSSTASVKEA